MAIANRAAVRMATAPMATAPVSVAGTRIGVNARTPNSQGGNQKGRARSHTHNTIRVAGEDGCADAPSPLLIRSAAREMSSTAIGA